MALILPIPGGSSYEVTYAADPGSAGASLLALLWIPNDQAAVPAPQSTSIAAGASGSLRGKVPAKKDARWVEIVLDLPNGTGSGTLTLKVGRSIHTREQLLSDTTWKALVHP